jgi:two-component sensor histidine kinase
MDVTAAKDREAALASTVEDRDRLLAQKEILFAEVHHRIKNSLQIVSSILALDAGTRGAGDPQTRIRRAAARVMAVASVHELIYKSGQVATVDIDGYLVDLCRTLEASVKGSISCEAQALRLDTDRAIGLALLVNELVTNAFSHGLRGRTGGHVEVECARDGDGILLRVADDGVGKPPVDRPGLGTRIVTATVAQLDATMHEGPAAKADRDGSKMGHEVLIRIPIEPRDRPSPPTQHHARTARFAS